jgi:hypothetical protein
VIPHGATLRQTNRFNTREAQYFFGGSEDLAWKKIADVTIPEVVFRGASFEIIFIDAKSNHGSNTNQDVLLFTASCYRSGPTVNIPDNATVSGPVDDYVRVVRTALGVYEIQVRQISNFRHNLVKIKCISDGTDTTIVYPSSLENGSTTGAIYTVTRSSASIGNSLQAHRLESNFLSIGNSTNRAVIEYTASNARTYTIPDAGANANFVMTEGNQTINGNKTFSDNVTISNPSSLSFGSFTRQMLNLWSNTYALGIQNGTLYQRSGLRFSWHRGGVHSNTENDPGTGGTVAMTLDGGSNLTVTGAVNAATFNATSTTNGGFQGIASDTATVPSFTWTGNLNTGLWLPGTGQLGITTSGVNRLTVSTTNITSTVPLTVGGNVTFGTQANKATIAYTASNARTYAIPDVGGVAPPGGAPDADFVMTESNQTINGLKTFGSNPRSSATQGTNAADLTRRDFVTELDSANVKLTGNQTIAGNKTFTGVFNVTNNTAISTFSRETTGTELSVVDINRSTDGNVMRFSNDGGTNRRGSINVSGTTTSYNTTSDYRLKENVVDLDDALERVKQIPVHRFNFIGETRTIDGFIAHEVQDHVPEAVSGKKDAVVDIGNIINITTGDIVESDVPQPDKLDNDHVWVKTRETPDYQQMDAAKLVPLLTASIHELISKIEYLEKRIETLEKG